MSEVVRAEDLATVLRALTQRVAQLERTRYRIPQYGTDPAEELENGDLWINTTSGALKARIGGVTKTITIT